MREVTEKVYKFAELTEEAKEKAREWFRSIDEYPWGSDQRASLKAFEREFPIKVRDWSVGAWGYSYCYGDVSDNLDDSEREMTGPELVAHLLEYHGKVVDVKGNGLTGSCTDYGLLEPMWAVIEKRNDQDLTYEQLLKYCLTNWADEYRKDIEAQDEDEYVDDCIVANDYEFYEDGSAYV
jgi:hypothetical protein